jgi:GNAT superfamily N-acetyltransferase
VLELHALYVLPEHWGTGVGPALYDRFPPRLGEAVGVLDVWDGNRRAIRFYERRGWVLDGRSRPASDGTAYVGMTLRVMNAR